ncbi:MAG: hypothetical protein ACHQFZ_08360 [Acidimicrobiales bacterium]
MRTQGQTTSDVTAAITRQRPTSPSRRDALTALIGAVFAVTLAVAVMTSMLASASRPARSLATSHAAATTSVVRALTQTPSSSHPARVAARRVPPTSSVAPVPPVAARPPVASVVDHVVTPSAPTSVAPSVDLRPAANVAPSPDFLVAGTATLANGVVTYENPCLTPAGAWPTFTNDPACTQFVLAAINNARAAEGVAPMALPANWYALTTTQQLFVVADLERVARGLPAYLGLNAALSTAAQRAAATRADPSIAGGFPIGADAAGAPAFGGAWAGGFSVLAADYVWMYDDGWAGSAAATFNVACTSSGAAGCWAHRDELLGADPGYDPGVGLTCATCEMGAGFAMVNGTSASFADLIERPVAGQPPMTFTWADEASYLG